MNDTRKYYKTSVLIIWIKRAVHMLFKINDKEACADRGRIKEEINGRQHKIYQGTCSYDLEERRWEDGLIHECWNKTKIHKEYRSAKGQDKRRRKTMTPTGAQLHTHNKQGAEHILKLKGANTR